MTAELFDQHAEDAEELIVAWLQSLRRSSSVRQIGDPLPFTIVTQVAGSEIIDLGITTAVVQVDTLCDRALGWDAAKTEADKTHRRMLLLARYLDGITLKGRQAAIDYCTTFETPVWLSQPDTQILRKVGRYQLGLSYVTVPQ